MKGTIKFTSVLRISYGLKKNPLFLAVSLKMQTSVSITSHNQTPSVDTCYLLLHKFHQQHLVAKLHEAAKIKKNS